MRRESSTAPPPRGDPSSTLWWRTWLLSGPCTSTPLASSTACSTTASTPARSTRTWTPALASSPRLSPTSCSTTCSAACLRSTSCSLPSSCAPPFGGRRGWSLMTPGISCCVGQWAERRPAPPTPALGGSPWRPGTASPSWTATSPAWRASWRALRSTLRPGRTLPTWTSRQASRCLTAGRRGCPTLSTSCSSSSCCGRRRWCLRWASMCGWRWGRSSQSRPLGGWRTSTPTPTAALR
mmetsp:Transcript_3180/g.9032  ORF Transcript_3180/g.9032 Transcript_3180/m.9032 type:complete len:238 (-) Transcript_3180:1905-2618(-)